MTSAEHFHHQPEFELPLRPLAPEVPELCEKAEERLMCALSHDGAIVLTDPVNGGPLMLYKIIGKPVALSVEDVVPNAQMGTMRGRYIWYHPDSDTQLQLEEAYDQGVTAMALPKGSNWAQMRAPSFHTQGFPDDTLDTISNAARRMAFEPKPQTVVVTNKHDEQVSKHAYRLSQYEDIMVGDSAHGSE